MIKFIHTADIHFGMENYGRVDAKTGIHSRLLDFEKVLNFCVDKAIEEKVDFFLFSGDAYKTPNPTPTHQRLFTGCLLRLYQAKIPIVMVVGNHDNPLSFGKAHALEIFGQVPLDGFYVISKTDLIVIKTKSGPVQIIGVPWPTKNSVAINTSDSNGFELTKQLSLSVKKNICEIVSRLDKSIPSVLAGHLTVDSGIFSGSEKKAVYGTDPLFEVSDLAIDPIDYVALGHLHRFQDLNNKSKEIFNIPVVYSGSLERIDFGERKEDKGFCLVTVNKSLKKTSYEFIKTPVRPFIQIEVTLDDNNVDTYTEQLIKEISKYNVAGAILKVVYFVPSSKRDRVDTVKIQQACLGVWYIVGIIPVYEIVNKERRFNANLSMDTIKLLDSYLDTKIEYKKNKKELIDKAILLERIIDEGLPEL